MKTINEELSKMKHLFEFKKGDVLTEGEDKECDCGNVPCNCDDNDNLGEMKLNSNMGWATDGAETNIDEDSEGEETFNYGEDEGEDHKEEEIPKLNGTKWCDIKLSSASGNADEIEFPFLTKICRDILHQKEYMNKLIAISYQQILESIENDFYENS